MKNIHLGIIGFGNMAEAITAGILNNKLIAPQNIHALDPSPKRRARAKKKYKLRTVKTVDELCAKTNTILLAVKPQQINEALIPLSTKIRKHLILTIVTGIQTRHYQKVLGRNVKVIRVMPNTPALIGQGAAVYFAGKNLTARDKNICEAIFKSVGIIQPVPRENLINAVTAISGSGPAFVYQYAQAVIDSAQKLGLSAKLARALVLQTMAGATQMMIAAIETPAQLTQKVASKGGTTVAGLEELKKRGFTRILHACMKRAAKRAEELGKE